MVTGTINGGLPPSPQQSTHSEQFTQSQLGPCAILQQHTYGHNEHFGNQVMHPEIPAHGMMFHPDGTAAFVSGDDLLLQRSKQSANEIRMDTILLTATMCRTTVHRC